MKPKDSPSEELPKWIDPVVKLLSYTVLSGKVSKKQRLDSIGILRTIEISTNMMPEEYDFFLNTFISESQRIVKKADVEAYRITQEFREMDEVKQLPKGYVNTTIFDVGVEE